MKTIGLFALLLSPLPFVHAATFDFTGSTVQGTITINGDDITSVATSTPQAINTDPYPNDYPTFIESDFSIPDFGATFDIYGEDSTYSPPPFGSDLQALLHLSYGDGIEPWTEDFTIQAGSSIVLDFDFAANGDARWITGFEFVTPLDRPDLFDAISVDFDTVGSILTLTFVEDFTLVDEDVSMAGRFLSTVPEPASSALLLGVAALGCATLRRRRSL